MRAVQQIVPEVVAEILHRQPFSDAKLGFAWHAAVGTSMSRATSISLTANGTLVVTANDVNWQREIERASGLILSRLARLLGAAVVRRLVVQGPRPGSTAPRRP